MQKPLIKPYIFRGYDIRAIIGEDLNNEGMELIGKAYGTYLHKMRINKAVVGYDNRKTSVELFEYFTRGLISCGINIINIGLTLSPLMYFSQYQFLSKGGAIVTASHNENIYNGLKLAKGYSETFTNTEFKVLIKWIKNNDFYNSPQIGTVIKKDIFPYYVKFMKGLFPDKLNFKAIVDTGNGTAGKFVPKFLRSLGVKVICQNTRLNNNFPFGTPDPTSIDFQNRLIKGVKENKADIGLSYDGDGDRLGVVDSEGHLIHNDDLLNIFSIDVLQYLPKTKVVYNVLCSKSIDIVIENAGGETVKWLTGHAFIKSKMREIGSIFGGELSGHFFWTDNYFGYDDALYATCRLLNYLQRNNTTLATEYNKLPRYVSSPQININLKVSEDKKHDIAKEVGEKLWKKYYLQAKVIDIDGIRLYWKTGMLVVRASQNGNYIVIKFEESTKPDYDRLKNRIRNVLLDTQDLDLSSGNNISEIFN